MKMKSIRLDFPASVMNGLSDAQVLCKLGELLLPPHNKFEGRFEDVRQALAHATIRASVHEFDDEREYNNGKPMCGPVFYIP